MHILIIEDNPADAFLTRMALQRCVPEHQIVLFEDGEPAMQYLEEPTSPKTDMIVLDLNLPRVDGLTFLRWLRGHAGISATPTFILSSSPADAVGEAAAAADGYLEKPATLDEYMSIGHTLCKFLGVG